MNFLYYDYAIFIAMLLFSILIGIYFGCFGSKQSTTSKYLLGEKKMKIIPIGISSAVSLFSGGALLGIPADTVRYGSTIFMVNICGILMALLLIYVYLPVLFDLQFTSAYEYLSKRFDKRTKLLALYLYFALEIIYFPILVYSPALVFSYVFGSNIIVISFVICIFCIFYTSIGGLKTVVWTDILQFAIIIASLIVTFYIGVEAAGGFSSVWSTALKGKRFIFDFDLNPTKRETAWSIVFGLTSSWVSNAVVHQKGVQKFLAVPKFRDCAWSVVCTAISKSAVLTFCGLIGLAMYARYSECDPFTSKKISKHDQLLPYYVMDVAEKIPGISGLFVSAIFSASLSTMSSLLNSLSALIFEHFLDELLKNSSEKRKSNILKLIVFVVGMLCTCLVFLIDYLGEIVALTIAFTGSINGPLLGMFTLGMLFPFANAKGAFYGGIGGVLLLASITITTKYYQLKKFLIYPTKPLSIEGCDQMNLTSTLLYNATHNNDSHLQAPFIFRISFNYFTLIGALVTIILGIVISYMTNRNSRPVDKNLISPVCRFLLPKEKTQPEDTELTQFLVIINDCNIAVSFGNMPPFVNGGQHYIKIIGVQLVALT